MLPGIAFLSHLFFNRFKRLQCCKTKPSIVQGVRRGNKHNNDFKSMMTS